MADIPGRSADLSLRAVVDALPRAVVVTDDAGRIVLWSARAREVYGWAEEEVLGRTAAEVLEPHGSSRAAQEVLDQVLAGKPHVGDRTYVHRDGRRLRVLAASRAVVGADGVARWVVVASEDVGDLRLLEGEARDLAQRLRVALDSAHLGTWRWDIATGEVSWDARMEELFGLAPGGFDGTFATYVAALHPDDRDLVLATIDRATHEPGEFRVEHRVALADGRTRWIHGAGRVTCDETGAATGAIGCSMDVTEQVERRLAVEAAAETARALADQERVHRERFEFLAALNDALAAATTVDDVVARVVRTAVPRLGDWCSIYLVDGPTDPAPRIATHHTDPAMVSWAAALVERYPYDPDAPNGMGAVIRTGQAEFHPDLSAEVIDEAIAASGYDPDDSAELREVLAGLRLRSSIAVPLVKRGRTLGGISFATTTDGRTYAPEDLDLARAVAGRVAASIENRRLDDHQRHIAQTLQASLLPGDLPDIGGLDVATRYRAAGEGTEVGGDFYDLFATGREGRWAAVIGDVCGTGPAAAALTGLARHSIRQAAWHGDDAATVLRWLNHALLVANGEGVAFITAAYLVLERARSGFDVEVAVAGHPLPVLVPAHGPARSVGRPGPLLGVFDEAASSPTTVHLCPGDVLVLFTDGLYDHPPPHGLDAEEVTEILAGAVRSAGRADEVAEAVLERIAARVPVEHRSDDTAIVVVRVVPLDDDGPVGGARRHDPGAHVAGGRPDG